VKRLLIAVAITVAVVVLAAIFSGVSFAATPTTEPTLPSDIGTYTLQGQLTCNKHAGKALTMDVYRKTTDDSSRVAMVISLNGQKIAQTEVSRNADAAVNAAMYVRNTPEGNWLKHEKGESAQAVARFLAEIGLTREQLDSCNEQDW